MRRAHALPAAALALTAAALFLSGGSSGDRLFWIGVAALLVASGAGVAVLLGRLTAPALSRPAAAFLLLLGALVLWQALSIAWSITPSRSWDYANRGLVYLAFACLGVLLAGLPRRWVAGGLAGLLGALFAVALAAKVCPALYEDYGRLARLRWPVEYWNELGLLAAVAVPLALWVARREHDRRLRIAGVLLLYLALVTVVLTYSRTTVVLAALAAMGWVALDRERLEGLEALALAVPLGGAVAAIGLALPGIRSDGEPGSVRAHDGRWFGLALVLGALLVAAAAWVVLGRELAGARRQLVARAAVAAVALVVLGAAGAAVVRAGGPVDFVRVRWDEFAHSQSPQAATRFGTASSGNRWTWWQNAWDAFGDHPAGGTGAGSFRLTSIVRAHNSAFATTEPHNVPLQFLSETGIVGFLFYAGAIAAAALALRRRGADAATRALTLVLALGVVHAIVDIDWDYVATQGPLLALAGFLVAAPGRGGGAPRRILPAAAVAIACLAALYSLMSPWLADRRLQAAYDAVAELNISKAVSKAETAHALNPLSVQPLYVLGGVEPDRRKARGYYVRATELEPQNPETWYELGYFEGEALGRWRAAYRHLDRSYKLDPYGPAGRPGGELDKARCKIDPATCR